MVEDFPLLAAGSSNQRFCELVKSRHQDGPANSSIPRRTDLVSQAAPAGRRSAGETKRHT
jgi:hypothetical protein